MAQAERKGLSKETVATIHALYLDAFRDDAKNPRKFDIGILPLESLEAEFDGAVKWKETDGTKPPNEREQERILQFGPASVQEMITRPIIRKINGDAYQAFLAAHPFSDDRELRAFAERERQAIDESRIADAGGDAGDAHRTADLVFGGPGRGGRRVCALGDRSFRAGCRMSGANQNQFKREMAQLFEALPTSDGATLSNFYALSLAFFAATA